MGSGQRESWWDVRGMVKVGDLLGVSNNLNLIGPVFNGVGGFKGHGLPGCLLERYHSAEIRLSQFFRGRKCRRREMKPEGNVCEGDERREEVI